MSKYQEIVNLNVGGTKFATSWHTLTWVPDTFFTALLSGRIPTVRDEAGAVFIDRDPKLFDLILNFLRTRDIDLNNVNIRALRHECDYFGITPLSRRLALCEEINHSSCGDVLFYGYLPPPLPPTPNASNSKNGNGTHKNSSASNADMPASRTHSRNSSLDLRPVGRVPSQDQLSRCGRGHSRAASLGQDKTDSHKAGRTEGSGAWSDSMKVHIIKAHHNWIAVAYSHFVVGYRLTDSSGCHVVFQSPVQDAPIQRIALNAKAGGGAGGGGSAAASGGGGDVMLGVASGSLVRLWAFSTHLEPARRTLVGTFKLGVLVEQLMFVGRQLVALGLTGVTGDGVVGVWHGGTQQWQTQDVPRLSAHTAAGSALLLGTEHGAINYIDMQKFPLRMKDNDLLVTQLYRDPDHEPVTAISVYLTPKTNLCGNWIEIAYGTRCGSVRVIVQHPETVGHGPQLFQTFTVHQSPITKVSLSEKYLVSVCSEYWHVRSWRVTRFRGMISTQPGSAPRASFTVLTLPPDHTHNDPGPYGEQDEEQIFIQKVVPDCDTLYVRRASDGNRVCRVRSVDGSGVSCFAWAECEGALRPRRLLLTGHRSGAAQLWDLTPRLDLQHGGGGGGAVGKKEECGAEGGCGVGGGECGGSRDGDGQGGPAPTELVRLLAAVDLYATPMPPSTSPTQAQP